MEKNGELGRLSLGGEHGDGTGSGTGIRDPLSYPHLTPTHGPMENDLSLHIPVISIMNTKGTRRQFWFPNLTAFASTLKLC